MDDAAALRLLGRNVARLRLARGWSQEDLAHESGVKPFTAISKIERGLRNPTVITVARLARALDVGLDDLLAEPPDDSAPA